MLFDVFKGIYNENILFSFLKFKIMVTCFKLIMKYVKTSILIELAMLH
jgi:uncharacterized protein YybS (DUF2232 family)